MEQDPADKDDYYYLVWEISSYIENITQKYNFSLEDFVTNLTDGTAPEDYEVVGYKLAGERYFSNKNTVENQTLDRYRYDYVLTRHKKETFTGRFYKLKNTVTAKVHPVDGVDSDTTATSSNTFSWDPSFVPPIGHFDIFKYGNNNWYERFNNRWNYANYDLDKLQSGEKNVLKGFKYYTETLGNAYPWTLKDDGDIENFRDYGVNNVNYETYDENLYLEDDEAFMNTADYYLDYFTYSISNQDAEFDDFNNKFNTKSAEYGDDEIITFYAKFGDRETQEGNEWKEIGTYNLKTKEVNVISDKVQEMTTSKVTFKDGVQASAWKFTTSNKHYYTGITVTPYYVLTKSDYVLEKIENKSKINIKNVVHTKITDHNNRIILEKDQWAYDYARVTYYDSDITKTVSYFSNKKAKKQYKITWKINVWEKATSGEGEAEYIQQENGKFYDIVPLGGDIDVNSIQVQTEKGFLQDNEFSYEIVTNYKNSGRTMLIVTIDEQADYYNVYYTTVHSWESMKDYGRNVLNPVAFETGNSKITKGSPDDGGSLSNENKQLFNDLDGSTNDEKFLYAERTHNINALTAALSGLQNKVKNSTDEDYKYDSKVEPGEMYTYRLRFENTNMNSANNLVFFDSIENFKVVDEEKQIEKTSGWHGTLKGIDLNQLKQKGIDAKVYVSKLENLDLEENHDLENTAVWQLATEQTDLSLVKAVAIDMTKKTDGEDFVLSAGDSVSAVLYMQAPENFTPEIQQNQYAYSNVYMQNTLIDELGETVDYFIHQDYTSIKYTVVADVPMRKVNAQNEEEGIKGITFRLYGTSFYGNNVDEYITSSQNGYITFKSIEVGEYILQEYSGNKDWIEDHTQHVVVVNMDKSVLVDGNVISKGNVLKITNVPRAHTDVVVYKKDLVNKNKALEGAKFKLSGISDYGNEILMYAESDKKGKVVFADVEKGKYDLVEVSTIEGYVLNEYNKETFKVIVDENSNYDVQKKCIGKNPKTEIRYSHTPNINDEGIASSNYGYNLSLTDTVKIEGAESLNVEVYYSTYTASTNWVCVYDGSATPTEYNYNSSKSGKLGGNSKSYSVVNNNGYTTCSKWTGTITGDTAKFFFKSNWSSPAYGYYAIITGVIQEEFEYYESIYNNGKFEIYNEPLHGFSFIKKDLLDKNKVIEGVTFKVKGTSDYGNYFKKEATSNNEGRVTFKGLEKGTYTLEEVSTTENYVLNANTYTVKIDKMGDFIITGNNLENVDGEYNIYNEPKHSFYFVKEDEYNKAKLGGAKFRLFGSSNIGNTYDETATSAEDTGIVEFKNLESGTYFLKEIEVPNTAEVSFILDEEEKIIEVFEDGTIKLKNELIWPLEEREENEPYVWFNKRNKGQITITKKWADNSTNSKRQEPKIYISTVNNEEAYSKVYFRTADSTHSIIDFVTNQNVKSFKRNITLTEEQVTAKSGVVRLDNNYNDSNAKYKIYGWYENETLYWWTKADRAVLPANLDYYFQNEERLIDINWNFIYRKGFWYGTIGEEQITESITNMQNMFYGCISIENLNIDWFNNVGITDKTNMQYIFGNNGETKEGTMTALKYITFGNKFKLFDTSILPKGNWRNQQTFEEKENTELKGILTAGTYSKVGQKAGTKVGFETTLNGVNLKDWSVFYTDEDYTYLILDGYLPNSAINNIWGIQTSESYGIYASSNRTQLINGLSTKSNWEDLVYNGKLDGIALSYDVKYDMNVYANGSPSLDLWVKSWNSSYPDSKLYTSKASGTSEGYYVGDLEEIVNQSSSIRLSEKAGYHNTLYFPSESYHYRCNGYWIASPAAFSSDSVYTVSRSGYLQSKSYAGGGYNGNNYAARPIICLPSYIFENKREFPKVGDTVHYSPIGNYNYNYNADYATSYKIDSSEYYMINNMFGEAITEWKVLNVNKETGKIDIVPTAPTYETVTFHGAQGYNNAVYLLNEICNELYSDPSKEITARSINIDDIENIIREAGYEGQIPEPTQTSGAYDVSNSKYPEIYEKENLSTAYYSWPELGLSEQTDLIQRNQWGAMEELYIGAIEGVNSLTRPYQTKYDLDNSIFNTALGEKANIILPGGTSTRYWIASRCIDTSDSDCNFCIRDINNGNLESSDMFNSSGEMYTDNLGLFPIVTIGAEYFNEESDNVYKVE